ncbi:MAG: YigZ family protein [Bacteroidales bacterium]|nr:YigZ family protein [Bacteroidales bacterium]MBR2477429.1 YigZ family protein [Bacteroidales bacterium]
MDSKNTTVSDCFKSIATLSTGLFKDNGSKFLAFAYPVTTEEEIKGIIQGLKKEYYDARHHCYAYRLGHTGAIWRMNDDGEPSSTAGRPIYGQILSAELSDILVVVVRYFGGIKLGVPGLIRAYKTSTADAIANATIIEKIATEPYRIIFDYLQMNSVMKRLKDLGLTPTDQQFNLSCSLRVDVRLALIPSFLESFYKLEGCRIEKVEAETQEDENI